MKYAKLYVMHSLISKGAIIGWPSLHISYLETIQLQNLPCNMIKEQNTKQKYYTIDNSL